MLSQRLLDELGQVLKDDYGLNLKSDKVFEIGNGLVNYFDLLAKWDLEQQLKQSNEDYNEPRNKKE